MEQSGAPVGGQSDATNQLVARKHAVGDATKIEASGPGELVVTRAIRGLATVTAVAEDHERIEVEPHGDTLKIAFKGGLLLNRGPKSDIRYEVALLDLAEVKLSGGIVAQIAPGEVKSLKVKVSDGARVSVTDLRASSFEGELSDGSQLSVGGMVEKAKVKLSGGSSFQGDRLDIQEAEVEAGDGANATVRVRKRLKARAGDGASINYIGDNVKLDVKTDEGGNVRQIANA